MPEEGLVGQIKRFVVGEPIPSHLAHHERLSRTTGLAVLSSDPLSSVAYATEEILRVLILVNLAALSLATPIAFIIASILAIVVHHLFHNQRALLIKGALLFSPTPSSQVCHFTWSADCALATAAAFSFAYVFEREGGK